MNGRLWFLGYTEGAPCVSSSFQAAPSFSQPPVPPSFSAPPRDLESLPYLPKPASLIPPGIPPPLRHLCLRILQRHRPQGPSMTVSLLSVNPPVGATGMVPLCVLPVKGSPVCLHVCALSRTLPAYYQQLVLIGAGPEDRKII